MVRGQLFLNWSLDSVHRPREPQELLFFIELCCSVIKFMVIAKDLKRNKRILRRRKMEGGGHVRKL